MNKGQVTTGVVLVGFISVLVGLILLQGTFDFMGQATNEFNLVNRSFTMPAAGSTIDLIGQELLSTPVVINQSTLSVVPATNYTIAEGLSSVDGLKRIRLTSLGGLHASRLVNITYQYGSEGYIEDSGARSVADLIPIFASIAIAIAALVIGYNKGMFD